jgi:serine/threonine protein kinase
MPDSLQCDKCGSTVAPDAPLGLCPNCLLRTAIEYGAGQTLSPFLPKLRYFGDYELLEEIARGGMGVVYRARQLSLDRIVAVKMMRPGLLATDAEIRRFHTEAKTAARLQHPNIVAIHEVGEFDGLHYFSMDFVTGPSLAALMRERPLSTKEAAKCVQVLAETVQHAHSQGILHRDLKPSNVLMDANERPRITDFGLAWRLEGDGGATASGTVMGTPAYMPPEQAAGQNERLSPASDVYSLGAILYELLTGQPPFRAATTTETVRQVLEEQPVPPHRLNPSVTGEIEAICLRCLAKEPADRYASAAALESDLARFLADEPSQPRVRNYRTLVAWAMIVIAVVLLWTTLRNRQREPVQPPARTVFAPPPSAPIPSPPPAAPKPRPAEKPSPKLPSAVAPVSIAISPARGVGYSQLFTIRFPHAEKSAAGTVEVAFSDSTGDRSCAVFLDPENARVELQFDPAKGPGLRVSGNAGTLNRVENSICAVDLAEASFTQRGENLEVLLPVVFKPAFEGPKNIKSWVWDKKGTVRTENQTSGEWMVGPGGKGQL